MMNSRTFALVFGILCLALLVVAGVLYSSNQKQGVELAQARQESDELEKLRGEAKELEPLRLEHDELIRLRKDNEELHRLRAEVHQLKEEKRQASRPGPGASGATGAAIDELRAKLQAAQAENQQLRGQSQQLQQLQAQSEHDNCINNLRMIDGAKQQWALENKKRADTPVRSEDITPYLKDNAIPACPSGGTYTLNIVGIKPTCSLGAVAGHTF